MKTNIAYIALGSNLGNKRLNIETGIQLIKKISQTKFKRVSRLYKTPAEGKTNQPNFLNAVARIDTELDAETLLDELMSIEKRVGRVRTGEKNEPRVIDLDILLYGNEVYNNIRLTIPHPRMHQRRFVLEPLNEIAPDLVHPTLWKTIRILLNGLLQQCHCEKRSDEAISCFPHRTKNRDYHALPPRLESS